MINLSVFVLTGAIAGLHSACWGSYRDPPYEKFSKLKFIRSIILGAILGVILFYLLQFYNVVEGNLGIIFVFIMGFERVFTEFFKIFVREEDERKYKIPMKFQYLGNIVKNQTKRFLIGIGFIISSFLIFHFLTLSNITASISSNVLIGLLAGVTVAFCGAWRASPFEGFSWRKFFKSPISGLLGGITLGNFSQNFSLLFFGSIGMLHMILQLVKIISLFLIGESAPSKFGEKKPIYKKYLKTRYIILLPYAFTWICFLIFLLGSFI